MKDIYSVGQINRYIKGMFSQDILLRNVYIRGEVSNCKYHSSGHIYFSLKDASGTLSCIMFAGNRRNLQFPMKNGDRVICGGTVDVYEKGGSYQLYARDIRLEGAGLLYEQFIALRNELKEMGMFEKEYKKPIPKYAMKVGVVTAPEGAAIRDIQNISHRRNPYVQLYLYPARVQGEGAKASIVRGIRVLDDFGVDVIIIGRGGGSLEDLWAFNEREVAEAVFACSTPVVSAVGHETDVTIADFVADMRAPTPSAAAELCVFDYEKFRERTERLEAALRSGTERRIERSKGRAEALLSSFHNITARRVIAARGNIRFYGVRLEALSPKNRINDRRRTLADAEIRMSEILREKIFENYSEEIPYSCQVEIEAFKEGEERYEISAIIYVLRDSQKGIIIGKGGSALKRTATQARIDMEDFFQKKVFLSTFVKVDPDWRNSRKEMRRFGYEE